LTEPEAKVWIEVGPVREQVGVVDGAATWMLIVFVVQTGDPAAFLRTA
jgi:hypothetical protein